MPHELLNVLLRRQAIERGLKQYFSGTVLDSVLSYWEQQYSEKPAFVLNRFLNEICTTEELRYHRKNMLKDVLYELSNLEKHDLLEDERVAVDHLKIAIPKDVQHAFLYVVDAVLTQVSAVDQDEFKHAVQQALLQQAGIITNAAEIQTAAFVQCLAFKQYSTAITTIYQQYCEFYGPLKADRVYASIKNQLKQQLPDVDLHQLL